MKNWVFEGSMNRASYQQLHTGANLCDTTVKNAACDTDCGSNTTKVFSFSPGQYKYFRLRMTSLDSCSSDRMIIHGFDLFGTFIYSKKQCTCLKKQKYIPYCFIIVILTK